VVNACTGSRVVGIDVGEAELQPLPLPTTVSELHSMAFNCFLLTL